MKHFWVMAFVLGLLFSNRASASLEINGLFDARSAAMGGTGVAFLDSAGAIPTNPALMDLTGQMTLSANAFLIVAQPEAPRRIYHLMEDGTPYSNYESIRSKSEAAVIPFVGGTYRLFDRIVIGGAIYPIIGQGTSASYKPAPEEYPDLNVDIAMSMGLIEAALPISIRLLENLSVGFAWRATYMVQSVSQPLYDSFPADDSPGLTVIDDEVIYTDIEMTGWNFAGFQAGVLYRPVPELSIGFTYRSKVTVPGDGTLTLGDILGIGGPMVLSASQNIANPHSFRGGIAVNLMEGRLLLAADFKYLMYAEAWEETSLTTRSSPEAMPTVNAQPANWTDAYAAMYGAEFKLSDVISVRGGYTLASTATVADFTQAAMPPPGHAHLFTAGVGINAIENVSFDLSAGYVMIESKVYHATSHNAGVGIYASHAGEFSLSATYRM